MEKNYVEKILYKERSYTKTRYIQKKYYIKKE